MCQGEFVTQTQQDYHPRSGMKDIFIFLAVWGQTIDDIAGNADPEALKTSIYIKSEQQKGMKNHSVSSPRFHMGVSSLTHLAPKNNPLLTMSWKDS